MKDYSDNMEKDSRAPAPNPRGKEFASRRSVVKGMASAVPVVMTIGCGKALAQASLSCVVTTRDNPSLDVCIDAGSTDEYVRIPTGPEHCPTKPGVGNQITGEQNKLVYVDENGNPGTSNSGYPVTQSCYASFLAV